MSLVALKEINFEELQLNPMTLIGQEWMLVTAGNEERGVNTMTAAWGHLGAIWELPDRKTTLPTAVAYVRPQRYTKVFMDREAYFTLTMFDPEWRKTLGYLGTVSGRDEDKIGKSGLTPVYTEETTWFEEAKLVFVCRKLYQGELLETGFVDQELLDRDYPKRDFHTMYIGEIVKVLVQE